MEPPLQCIMRANNFRLNAHQKQYIDILFMFLGWATPKSNSLFVKNYQYYDRQNAPIEHIMILIWKVYVHYDPNWDLDHYVEAMDIMQRANMSWFLREPPIC